MADLNKFEQMLEIKQKNITNKVIKIKQEIIVIWELHL